MVFVISGLFQALVLAVFRLYRVLFSPLKPACCRFSPSCSGFALEAVRKYGCWRGGILAVSRILRCHPFSPGGEDPVP